MHPSGEDEGHETIIALLKRAIEKDPDYRFAYEALARIYTARGQQAAAEHMRAAAERIESAD